MSELNTFSKFSGLKPNQTKFEVVGIGVLNGVQVALSGMKFVNLNNKTMKILGVLFLYNKNLEQDKNFCEHIVKIESILKHFKIMAHKTVNFRRKNYGLQILSYF